MFDQKSGAAVAEKVPAAPRQESSPPRQRRWTRFTPWLFLAIPLAFLLTFTFFPVANLLFYSLTKWDGFSPEKPFVGADNYVQLFTRPELFQVFFVSLYYLASGVVQMVVALYFATVLSFNTRFRNFFKGVLFFPYQRKSVV